MSFEFWERSFGGIYHGDWALMVVCMMIWSWCVDVGWSGVDFVHNWCWVHCWGLVDDCVEAIVVIGGVVDGSDWAIGFDERVWSLDDITVAMFVLWFHVTGVEVLDATVNGEKVEIEIYARITCRWEWNSLVEFVFGICDGLWDDDFVGDWHMVDWSVCVVDWCLMVSGQWSVDGRRASRSDEKGGDDEELWEGGNGKIMKLTL